MGGLILVGACSQAGGDGDASAGAAEPPMAGADLGGPFTLQNADGETVTNQDFAGQYRLVYFGYTFCPDVCPVDVQRMGKAYAELKQSDPELAARLQPIFITIDPERDTPQVAQEFADNFGPGILGLSGTPEQIETAAQAYRVYYSKGDARDDGFYLMDHSAYIYLMDENGEPVNFYDRGQTPAQMAADIRKWMTS